MDRDFEQKQDSEYRQEEEEVMLLTCQIHPETWEHAV